MKPTFRKMITAFATLLVALGLTVAVASPASASYSACPSGHACVYTSAGGTGSMFDIVYSTHLSPPCWNFAATYNNTISSVITLYGSGHGLRLFVDNNCGGAALDIPANSVADNLSDWYIFYPTTTWNDRASSFMII